jgi:hypothetical protein
MNITVLERKRRTAHRLAVAAVVSVVALLIVMWVYAFFFADTSSPDRLKDRAWAAQAQATCQPYADQIAALPPARQFADIRPKTAALSQRAPVVDRATDLLAQMVTQLRRTAPADTNGRQLVTAWLADYDSYLASRRVQTAKWRAGEDPRFAVADVDGQPVDSRMDDFADANAMTSCKTPGDLA